MATTAKKRTTTKRRTAKPGASKAPKRKRVSAAAGPKKRIAIAGKFYTHDSCTKTKTAATHLAASKRKAGKLARVVSNGKMFCVYTRG